MDFVPQFGQFPEPLPQFLVALQFLEPLDQLHLGGNIEFRVFLLVSQCLLDVLLFHKGSGLEKEQDRGHVEIVPGHIEIEFLHPLYILQVLAGDLVDVQVADAHLLLLDQQEEQPQRPIKRIGLDVDAVV